MRIDLRAQCLQLGAAGQPAQLLLALAEADVLDHHAERAGERLQQPAVVAEEWDAVGTVGKRDLRTGLAEANLHGRLKDASEARLRACDQRLLARRRVRLADELPLRLRRGIPAAEPQAVDTA